MTLHGNMAILYLASLCLLFAALTTYLIHFLVIDPLVKQAQKRLARRYGINSDQE